MSDAPIKVGDDLAFCAQVHRQRLLEKLAHVYWPDMPDAVLERVYRIVEDEYRGNGEVR